MGETAIRVEDLTKRFGSVLAVDGVDLEVPKAAVFGLLGPNGAGKTTTIRVLSTILEPDSGRAEVLGHDVVREAKTVRRLIGLAGQYAAVDGNLTGHENLRLIGRLVHLPRREINARADALLRRFELTDAADRPFAPTPEACAGESTSRQRSSTARRFCTSTSPPPDSTRTAATRSGR